MDSLAQSQQQLPRSPGFHGPSTVPAEGIPVHGPGHFRDAPEPPAPGFQGAPAQPQPVAGSAPAGQGVPVTAQPPGFLDNCLNVIRCCNAMEDCYRLNGGCCTGGCWDEGCCADVSGCFSGLFSFLDSLPQ